MRNGKIKSLLFIDGVCLMEASMSAHLQNNNRNNKNSMSQFTNSHATMLVYLMAFYQDKNRELKEKQILPYHQKDLIWLSFCIDFICLSLDSHILLFKAAHQQGSVWPGSASKTRQSVCYQREKPVVSNQNLERRERLIVTPNLVVCPWSPHE